MRLPAIPAWATVFLIWSSNMSGILHEGDVSAGTLLPDSYRWPPHFKTLGARNEEVGLILARVSLGYWCCSLLV